ncbi:indoleacetamide hydrolase [Streptomyces sp. NPDC047061]|uniref:indoleacetamide hydrolase n=1 Tax=Streptomyces sp. NPDC047061 TaxID=3154605 RepID=UPI00340A0304
MTSSSHPAVPRRRVLAAGAALPVTASLGLAAASPVHAQTRSTGRPGTMGCTEQLHLTATDAVEAIAAGRLSAVVYVRTLLERAEALEDLRLVITLDHRGALAAAGRIDAARRAGKRLGPLAGLPLLVKDNINTRLLRTTGATPALARFRPNDDAPVLRRLLDAGAVVLGKANMHELALGVTNTNFSPFAGFARNPYDRDRIPGGSSGGTAAAIAARIVPAGLGTDTGSSVRLPAAFNGVVGLRPSVGNGGRQRRYSGQGVLPLSHTLDTVGPIGRTVADVALLDSVVTGACRVRAARPEGLRLGVPPVLWKGLEHAVDEVGRAAKSQLARAGVELVEVDLPGLFDLSNEIIFPVALHEAHIDIPRYLSDSGARNVTMRDIAAETASPDVHKVFQSVLADDYASAYPDAMNVHRPEIQRLVGGYFARQGVDALLFPTAPVLPSPIDPVNGSGTMSVDGGPQVDTFTTSIRNTAPGSCVGMPGLVVPGGMAKSGLPVGLSLEGPVGSDRRLLAIGMALEKILGPAPAPRV